MPSARSLALACLLMSAAALPARAHEVNAEPTRVNRAQPVAVPDPAAPRAADGGTWTLNGAIRARVDGLYDDADPRSGARRSSRYAGFDTLILKGAYESDTLFAAVQYHFYGGGFPYTREAGYRGIAGEVNFPAYAYAGWKLSATDSVTVGINQVPFAIVPYFGISYLETLGFPLGIEDVHNLGIKYSYTGPDLNWQLAYYPADGGKWVGISRDSARYSANLVAADAYVPFGSNNSERDMLVGRVEYTPYRTEAASITLGASVWHSRIRNIDTRRDGTKQQEALHAIATYGPWTVRAIGMRQDIDPRNPGRRDLVTLGSFDGSYTVATKGTFVSGELAYKIPEVGPFSAVVPYLNYSTFLKDKAAFRNSERVILGAALTVRDVAGLFLYPEIRFGRNDPYTGAGQYLTGLGPGGDDRWKTTVFTSIGYYF